MNNCVLPFYENRGLTDYNKPWTYGEVFRLICPRNTFLTFQVPRTNSKRMIESFLLSDGQRTINFTEYFNRFFIRIKVFQNYDMILGNHNPSDFTSPGGSTGAFSDGFSDGFQIATPDPMDPDGLEWPPNFPLGIWYAIMSDGEHTWYSEKFQIIPANALKDCMKMTWANEKDIIISNSERLTYDNRFKHELWIDAAVCKPEYPFEEEVIDRDGHPFVIKQISEKRYRFEFAAPEYLCDALRLVRMHTDIQIQINQWETLRVENIVITPEWQKHGNLAIVRVEFETDVVVFNSTAETEDVALGTMRIEAEGIIPEGTEPAEIEDGDKYLRVMPAGRFVYTHYEDGETFWTYDKDDNKIGRTVALPDGRLYFWKDNDTAFTAEAITIDTITQAGQDFTFEGHAVPEAYLAVYAHREPEGEEEDAGWQLLGQAEESDALMSGGITRTVPEPGTWNFKIQIFQFGEDIWQQATTTTYEVTE